MAMKGFLKAAAKQNSDIREFLRDAAGGNSIKYVAEKDMKHMLFFPYEVKKVNVDGVEKEVRSLFSISTHIHEWNGADGKYHSTVCIKDVVLEDEKTGEVTNDGSCPFCDRISDAWEIFGIRKEREEASCGLSGADLEKHMKDVSGKFASERKAKEASDYLYVLVAKFRQDKNGTIILNETTKIPEYDLKVMRLPAKRSEKLMKACENSGVELAGTEIIFDYPNTEDIRHMYTDMVITPIVKGTTNSLVSKFSELEAKILEDANNFEWDGIEKSFPEWNGMTTKEAQIVVSSLFKKYDEYKNQLEINPSAQYMEYLTAGNTEKPSLGNEGAQTNPNAVKIPNVTGASEVDVNNAFGGIGTL